MSNLAGNFYDKYGAKAKPGNQNRPKLIRELYRT